MLNLKLLRNFLLSGVNTSRVVSSRSLQLFKRPNSAEEKKDEDEEEEEHLPEKFSFEEDNLVDPAEEEERIAQIRDKSRLRPAHRNMVHNVRPYEQAQSWIHNTLKYQRMLYGKLGKESGYDPRICFYTEKELAEKAAYNRASHPWTILQMMDKNEMEKQKKADYIKNRQELIAKNLAKVEQWKQDFIAKKEKKEEEARVAKERKDRLIDEVRRHFGYTVHPKDDRFKELLEKKEKEQKKALKEERRKVKETKLLEKIASSNKQIGQDKKAASEEKH